MKILITGATGSLGAYLVRYFAAAGHHIIALGRMAHAPAELLRHAQYLQADVSTPLQLPDADVCIHAAAVSDDKASAQQLYPANVQGTINVAKATQSYRKFIHVSSSSVYLPEDFPLKETMAGQQNNKRLSPYGFSKLQAEEALREASQHEACYMLRPRVLYGPYDKVILPRMLRTVKNGVLYRPGSMKINVSMTHYRNFAHAIDCCLNSEAKGMHVYNVADAQPYVLIEIMRKMMQAMYGHAVPEKQIPVLFLRLMAVFKLGGITPLLVRNFTRNAVLDISKIQSERGYHPPTDFDRSLPELEAWVRSVGGVEAIISEEKSLAWA